jgi:hypothetical protein
MNDKKERLLSIFFHNEEWGAIFSFTFDAQKLIN